MGSCVVDDVVPERRRVLRLGGRFSVSAMIHKQITKAERIGGEEKAERRRRRR